MSELKPCPAKPYELYCGDCLALMKDIPCCSVELVATDCPYHIVSGGCTNKGKGNGIFQREKASSGKLFDHNEISFSDWLPDVFRVLKPDCHCYIMVNGRNLKELQQKAENVGFVFQNLLVWDKGNVTPNRYYMNACEFVLMLKKGKSRTINNPGTASVLRFKNPTGKKIHPTEKPVDLMQCLIENSTRQFGTVLDPFMGSGSTGVACVNAGRKFIGMELDNTYFQIAKARIEEAWNRRVGCEAAAEYAKGNRPQDGSWPGEEGGEGMKAYVCDKCGKVVLLEDDRSYEYPSGVYTLVGYPQKMNLDLCEDCVNELVEAVRGVKEGDTNG